MIIKQEINCRDFVLYDRENNIIFTSEKCKLIKSKEIIVTPEYYTNKAFSKESWDVVLDKEIPSNDATIWLIILGKIHNIKFISEIQNIEYSGEVLFEDNNWLGGYGELKEKNIQ